MNYNKLFFLFCVLSTCQHTHPTFVDCWGRFYLSPCVFWCIKRISLSTFVDFFKYWIIFQFYILISFYLLCIFYCCLHFKCKPSYFLAKMLDFQFVSNIYFMFAKPYSFELKCLIFLHLHIFTYFSTNLILLQLLFYSLYLIIMPSHQQTKGRCPKVPGSLSFTLVPGVIHAMSSYWVEGTDFSSSLVLCGIVSVIYSLCVFSFQPLLFSANEL